MARSVDQQTHASIRLIAARRDLFARQGTVVATWRQRPRADPLPTSKCGPYYRLAYREDGRQRSIYLGREGPLVDKVRQMLADLQRPLRQQRAINRVRRQVCAALTAQKRRVDAQLRPLGLRLKGFEVRGWRTSLLRGLWPTPPAVQPIKPLRRPQYRVSSLRSIRPPKLPRYNARMPTPAAIEERLWKAIAAREGHGSQ